MVVKTRIPGYIILVFFHEIPEPLPVFLGHGRIGLELFLRQVHGLAVQLQFLLRLLPLELDGLFLSAAVFELSPDGLLGKEKAVKDHPQGVFHLLPVFQP